ncbi:MAG: hypothetical protein KGI11_09245 [Thaumarchaeota archaeon]|nr:hypothetical protein [Nitrososphaerota archaeon]
MLSQDLYYAFLGLGAAFAMWGIDKILEVFPSRFTRYAKALLGLSYFIMGVIIVVLVISAGHT